ncbi:predicted protein [Postia placenta Mad-698-R]|nr:predicted protein [Postia placenta Mad-698-R]
MLAFSSPGVQSSLVVKSAATIRPSDRLVVGRDASLIVPRLYLSNLLTAEDEQQLTALGITHVVSVIEHPPNLPKSLPHLKTLHIPITDSMGSDLLRHLDETTAFIRAALAEDPRNNVLVHCFVGMSRSATVVCAFLIATTSMNAADAIGFVASKRCVASPNIGFRRQLEEYSARFHPPPPRVSHRIAKVSGVLVERLRWWKSGPTAGAPITGAEQVIRTVATEETVHDGCL